MLKTKNQVRIIGGKWRSRKLHFPDLPTLRPTPDRVRETLFNWLSPYIVGARCLDLFAGSGALGFEALSRGAASVVMIDQSPVVIKQLRENAKILNTEKDMEFFCESIPSKTFSLSPHQFDIVFLDPPFHQNYISQCCEWLEDTHCLAENALIYIEIESNMPQPLPIPESWKILKSQKAGQVSAYLIKKEI